MPSMGARGPALAVLLLVISDGGAAYSARTDEGIRLFDERRLSESCAALGAALREDPSDARAAYYLGRALMAEDDLEAARPWFERAVELDPGSSEKRQWLGRCLGFMAARGSFFKQTSLAPKIRRAFEKAVELDPDNVEARLDLLEYYIQAPAIMGGSHERARKQAIEIARRDRMRGYRAQGRIEDHEKHFDAALALYARAVAEFPDRIEPALWASNVGVARREWGIAFEPLEAFLVRNPGNMPVRFHIGRVAAISGERLAQGEECLRAYLAWRPGRDDPQRPQALERLAEICERRGERGAARRACEDALQLDASLKTCREGLKRLS
jgi:tetratricopeptide (TPR) repeat protein